MTDLVRLAFRTMGEGPTWRELELVADAIRESGDEQALALFEGWDTFDALVAVAEEAGAGELVALDLLTEVSNPGWRERRGCRATAQRGLTNLVAADPTGREAGLN